MDSPTLNPDSKSQLGITDPLYLSSTRLDCRFRSPDFPVLLRGIWYVGRLQPVIFLFIGMFSVVHLGIFEI
jgi:hypothetical protein